MTLFKPDGTVASSVTVPTMSTGQAYSLADGVWTTALPPTPNMENTLDSAMLLDSRAKDRRMGSVYISEVMYMSEKGGIDWIELYNSGSAACDLSGYGLSDRLNRPRRWRFPQGVVLAAGARMAIALVGSEGEPSDGSLSAPFAIPGAGDCTVCLSDPDGRIIDSLYLPAAVPGYSFGRDDSGDCGYLDGTPEQPTGKAILGPPAAPVYSVRGGLFHKGDLLEVSLSTVPGARVYYTLDCTDPDEHKNLYTGTPIPIEKTTILRTRVYMDGHMPSGMDTQSYLFDVKCADKAPYVVSLVSDPDGLYSHKRGIMVLGPNAEASFPYGDYNRGANFWMDWEREAHVELFLGATGETAISQECDIKVHGRNTRAYVLKSFKVMARKRYGDNRFRYPIFRNRPYGEYEAFILRYSGQDYKNAFMRDVVMTRQAGNTGVMYAEAEECLCYLNGKSTFISKICRFPSPNL